MIAELGTNGAETSVALTAHRQWVLQRPAAPTADDRTEALEWLSKYNSS